ncbi:MAG: hypothetical protein II453_18430 [Alphaproteobacteria bacterium]|nr:hypothetical protein [Alphaproteobacteria bacterium]
MISFIVFFPVDNSLEYCGSDFDGLNEKDTIFRLRELKRSGTQVRFYNLSNDTYETLFPNIASLVSNYNAEELDGGWFCAKFKWYGDEDELYQYLYAAPTPLDHMRTYLNSTTQTNNGTIYLKENWQNADPDEIIYIGEYGLDDLERKIEANEVMTDAELVEEGIASTKNSIRADIKRYYPEATDEWIDKHDLIADIIECCSWEYAATMIDQIGDWDIWDDYPEK